MRSLFFVCDMKKVFSTENVDKQLLSLLATSGSVFLCYPSPRPTLPSLPATKKTALTRPVRKAERKFLCRRRLLSSKAYLELRKLSGMNGGEIPLTNKFSLLHFSLLMV